MIETYGRHSNASSTFIRWVELSRATTVRERSFARQTGPDRFLTGAALMSHPFRRAATLRARAPANGLLVPCRLWPVRSRSSSHLLRTMISDTLWCELSRSTPGGAPLTLTEGRTKAVGDASGSGSTFNIANYLPRMAEAAPERSAVVEMRADRPFTARSPSPSWSGYQTDAPTAWRRRDSSAACACW